MNLLKEPPLLFLKRTAIKEPVRFCHDSYDIIYVLSGRLEIWREASYASYLVSDISFLSKKQAYTLSSDAENTILHMGLHPYFIEQALGSYGFFVCDSALEPKNDYTYLKQMVTKIASLYLENPEKNMLSITGLIFQLIAHLKQENYFAPKLGPDIPDKYERRISEIITYIDKNYDKPLTLSLLADALFLSPQYLSKFFKKYFNKNFKEYLLEKRLFHVSRDIRYTDDSITEIAFRHGFSDITAFNKAFRKYYHDTPVRYRKASHTQLLQNEYSNMDQHSTAHFSELNTQYVQTFSTDLSETHVLQKNFSILVNVGSAQNLLLHNFCQKLLEARQTLHFQYLRILGMVSSSFIPRVLPDYEYYFQNTEKVLAFLYQNDLIPFIELSRLSTYFAQSPDSSSGNFVLSKSGQYFQMLEAFLDYCANMYPDSWTSQWKFELWKPDEASITSYIKEFSIINRLIKKYLPGAQLGGPGFDSCTPLYEMEHILEKLRKENLHPDFISSHLNLFVKADDSSYQISMDKKFMGKQAGMIQKIVHSVFPSAHFYITEWNSAFWPDMPVQYTCFQSTFICKTALEINSCCDLLGYWLFGESPVMHNLLQVSPLHFWGQGMLNKDGLPLPSYHAFKILNLLGSHLIEQGENFCITQSEPDHYQILTFNYSHFSSSAILHTDKTRSFIDVYQLFENMPVVKMRFELKNLTPGTYRIQRHLLDRSHGSVLDIWIGGYISGNLDELEYLMKIKLPTPEELRYWQKTCIPEFRTIYLQAENSLSVETPIDVHNVCLWDISLLA